MLKKILLAAAALGVSSAALAHDGPGRGWAWGHEKHYTRYYAPRPAVVRTLVVPAPRVVYAPPPRVAYPYYAAPAYAAPAVSIRLNFPL